MQIVNLRERVAIVIITLSMVASFGLGAALAYQAFVPRPVATVIGTGPGETAQAPSTSTDTSTPSAAATEGGTATSGAPETSRGTTGHVAPARSGGGTAVGPVATPGVSGGVITIGGIFDETGPIDATIERDIVRAYFNSVNARGGVNGYRLRLLDCDSAYDPSRAHQCSQQLIDSGVLAVVGWLSVNGEQPEAAYLAQQGVPIIGGVGVPAEFQSPLSFPTFAALSSFGTAMGTHAKDLGYRAPGVVVLNANFIAPVEKAILDALHRQGIQEKSVDHVDATKPDYTDVVVKMRSEGADSVISGMDPFSYARLFQALARQNWHPPLAGMGLNKKSVEPQYGTAVYDAQSLTPLLDPDEHMDNPAIAEIYTALRTYYPSQTSQLDVFSEAQWVAAKVFVEAIRRIGAAPVTRQSLVASLNTFSAWDTGLTVPFTYRPGNHDPNRCFQWLVNQQGKWHTYSGWTCF
jgi:branched-chain amino acid transport system substrate-binding protein